MDWLVMLALAAVIVIAFNAERVGRLIGRGILPRPEPGEQQANEPEPIRVSAPRRRNPYAIAIAVAAALAAGQIVTSMWGRSRHEKLEHRVDELTDAVDELDQRIRALER